MVFFTFRACLFYRLNVKMKSPTQPFWHYRFLNNRGWCYKCATGKEKHFIVRQREQRTKINRLSVQHSSQPKLGLSFNSLSLIECLHCSAFVVYSNMFISMLKDVWRFPFLQPLTETHIREEWIRMRSKNCTLCCYKWSLCSYMIHVAEYIPELSPPDPVKPDTSHNVQELYFSWNYC